MKAKRSNKLLYDDITRRCLNLKIKYEYLCSKKELSSDSDNSDDLLSKRISRAKEKYIESLDKLSKYISFIPDERTRDCAYKAYIDGLNTQELCYLYQVDEGVITRELKAGRQIITALNSWETTRNSMTGRGGQYSADR